MQHTKAFTRKQSVRLVFNRQAALSVAGVAALLALSAAGAVTIDKSLETATQTLCDNLKAIQSSAFVAAIAVVMFVVGGFMFWFKVRGALAMMVTGLVGFMIIKNIVSVANSFGLKGC